MRRVSTVHFISLAFFLLIFTTASAQTTDSKVKKAEKKIEDTKEKINAKKAKLDSLLEGTPLGVSGGLGANADIGANIGGKAVKPADAAKFFTETLPDLGLKIKEVRKREKERRRKKKLFHTDYAGLPILKQVASYGNSQLEFHVLKEFRQPSIYPTEIFWYDYRARQVSKGALPKEKETAMVLHGPYKRYIDGELREEGYYNVGAKDGRWESYDKNYVLLDKTRWSSGFPAESQVTYYDSAHKKIREVIPIQYGKRKGDYFMFYEAGQMMAKGQYDNDLPVGTWTEYYQFRRQRHRVTRYPRYWYEDGEPELISEWDDKGKLIYERPKEKAVAESDDEGN
jgi:hypothetical protein